MGLLSRVNFCSNEGRATPSRRILVVALFRLHENSLQSAEVTPRFTVKKRRILLGPSHLQKKMINSLCMLHQNVNAIRFTRPRGNAFEANRKTSEKAKVVTENKPAPVYCFPVFSFL